MGTKLRKVTLYVLDLNNSLTDGELQNEFENMKYVEFVKQGNMEAVDVGEWSDDHPLNKIGADYEEYFLMAKRWPE